MRFIYHRENLRTCPTYLAGLLGAAALATLPIMAHAGDDGAEAMASPAVSDNISEAAPPAWQQIDNNSEIEASDGPILELPQVTATGRSAARTTDDSADGASTDDASADDDSANDEDATPPHLLSLPQVSIAPHPERDRCEPAGARREQDQ